MDANQVNKVLAKLPTVDTFGITKVRDGPPLPVSLGVKWPKFIRDYTNSHWPGVPMPRSWGEKVLPYLPPGVGDIAHKIIDTFGL
jgi:hypothetical protein